MNGEYSNWEEHNKRIEQMRKEWEKKKFIIETTVAAIVLAIAAVITTLALHMR